MKQLTCEMCGSTELVKDGGFFVCQTCGTKYSVEEAKKMMIEGTVDVQGTVKVDNSALIAKHLVNAHRALVKEDWEEVEKYYNLVEQNSPDNIEAVFFSSYGKAMLSMTDSDYFKREQKFQVLNRSMSVISEYYDTTTENKEEALKKIAQYIEKMYTVSYVYQRQSFDIGGAIRSLSAVTGSRQWCINLIDSTRNTFVNELRQIAAKHDDEFVKALIMRFTPQAAPAPTPAPQEKAPVTPSAGSKSKTSVSLILGIIGLVMAWLLAIVGHVVAIIGIILGAKESNETGKKTGLIVSIIAEVCAIISSLIGIFSMM